MTCGSFHGNQKGCLLSPLIRLRDIKRQNILNKVFLRLNDSWALRSASHPLSPGNLTTSSPDSWSLSLEGKKEQIGSRCRPTFSFALPACFCTDLAIKALLLSAILSTRKLHQLVFTQIRFSTAPNKTDCRRGTVQNTERRLPASERTIRLWELLLVSPQRRCQRKEQAVDKLNCERCKASGETRLICD